MISADFYNTSKSVPSQMLHFVHTELCETRTSGLQNLPMALGLYSVSVRFMRVSQRSIFMMDEDPASSFAASPASVTLRREVMWIISALLPKAETISKSSIHSCRTVAGPAKEREGSRHPSVDKSDLLIHLDWLDLPIEISIATKCQFCTSASRQRCDDAYRPNSLTTKGELCFAKHIVGVPLEMTSATGSALPNRRHLVMMIFLHAIVMTNDIAPAHGC